MAVTAPARERGVLKRPLMRIRVAVVATGVAQLAIMRQLLARGRLMASRTAGSRMLSRKRIHRLAVIKQLRRLPYVLRVARGALRTKFAFVRVLMTLRARAPHPQERLILILHADLCRLHGYLGRCVAAVALERGMFAHQLKPGHLPVVEALLIELGELKAFTVMFVVAAGAIQLVVRCLVDARMISRARVQPTGDFGVAIEALQRALPNAESMATSALRGTFQIRVRLG